MVVGLLVNSCISYAMEKETTEIFNNLSSLPTDVRMHILLQNPNIIFLSKQQVDFKAHNETVNSIATIKDKLITGSRDNTAKIWNINSEELLHTLKGHTDPINSVAATENEVITASDDNTAKIWDINTGQLRHTLKGHTAPINSVAATENEVITASDDNTAKVWALYSGQLIRTLEGHTSIINSVTVVGDKVVTASNDKTVKVWNLYNGKLLHTLEQSSWPMSVAIIGDKIIVGLSNDTAPIWDINTGKLLHTLKINNNPIENRDRNEIIMPIAITGNKVIIGSDYGEIVTWDIASGKVLLKRGGAKVKSIAMAGDRLIVGFNNGNVRIQKPSSINLMGTSENNPLLWILYKATTPQLEFIIRAAKATSEEKDLIMAMPPKLGTVQTTDSQKQVDGNTYFSFPPAVRTYLRSRLNIKRDPTTGEKFWNWLTP